MGENRRGISRLVVEIVILVVAVVLALLVFTPVGSIIASSLGGIQSTAYARLEVVGVDPGRPIPPSHSYAWSACGTGDVLWIYVMHCGPKPLHAVGGPGTPQRNWTIVLKNSSGVYTVEPCVVDAWFDDGNNVDFEKGEIWVLWSDVLVQDPAQEFTVEVYVKGGARAAFKYVPRG